MPTWGSTRIATILCCKTDTIDSSMQILVSSNEQVPQSVSLLKSLLFNTAKAPTEPFIIATLVFLRYAFLHWPKKKICQQPGLLQISGYKVLDLSDNSWEAQQLQPKLWGLCNLDAAPMSDSPKIHHFWKIRRAPIDGFEESEQHILQLYAWIVSQRYQ